MKDITEVWTAYREMLSSRETLPEDREAFWHRLANEFSAETLSDIRRVLEWYSVDEHEPTAEDSEGEPVVFPEPWSETRTERKRP